MTIRQWHLARGDHLHGGTATLDRQTPVTVMAGPDGQAPPGRSAGVLVTGSIVVVVMTRAPLLGARRPEP